MFHFLNILKKPLKLLSQPQSDLNDNKDGKEDMHFCMEAGPSKAMDVYSFDWEFGKHPSVVG